MCLSSPGGGPAQAVHNRDRGVPTADGSAHDRGMLSLQEFAESKRGVLRTAVLADAGYARAAVDRGVATGVLTRVRRGWVALPDADPYLIAAAAAGVVVSCVTAAQRLELWTPRGATPHVAARPHAGHVDVKEGTRVHRAKPLVSRHPDALDDEIENVLALVAVCQPYETALAVWESALNRKLVVRASLERLPLGPTARRLCAEVDPFADSGLESFAVHRLRWMGVPLMRQAWIAGRRVDLLIGERLVLQIDGGHHVGAQRAADIAHDAELMLLGYHVIRVGYRAMVDDWPTVQARIMRAVAQGLHLAR